MEHYEATVNRGDLNMRSLTDELNESMGRVGGLPTSSSRAATRS
jgi:hypothetical protein